LNICQPLFSNPKIFATFVTNSTPLKSARTSRGFLANQSDRRSQQLFADSVLTLAMVGDFAMIVFGLFLGFWIRFQSGLVPPRTTWWSNGDSAHVSLQSYAKLMAVGAIILFLTLVNLGLYQRRHLLRFGQVARTFLGGTSTGLFIYFAISQFVGFTPNISRIYVIVSFLAVNFSVLIWRSMFHRLLRNEAAAQGIRQNILLIGWNKNVTRLFESIHSDRSHPYNLIGYIDSPTKNQTDIAVPGVWCFGNYENLPDVIANEVIHIVVLADSEMAFEKIISLSNLCEQALIQFKVIPSYFQILVSGLHLETISGVPIMGVSGLPLDRPLNQIAKRAIDILGGIVGLILSSPIIAVCGILIYRESPGSIFFRQERVGRLGRRFQMLKLRSMKLGSEKLDQANQSTLRQDPRVLRIGSFIRKWSLDEVPQFWNVLMGEMSLVGPRPERTFHSEKLSLEIPHYNARYSCKPGITGWAQVNGLRGDTSLVERIRYDLYYLENWNLWLDFYIMYLTFMRSENAY